MQHISIDYKQHERSKLRSKLQTGYERLTGLPLDVRVLSLKFLFPFVELLLEILKFFLVLVLLLFGNLFFWGWLCRKTQNTHSDPLTDTDTLTHTPIIMNKSNGVGVGHLWNKYGRFFWITPKCVRACLWGGYGEKVVYQILPGLGESEQQKRQHIMVICEDHICLRYDSMYFVCQILQTFTLFNIILHREIKKILCLTRTCKSSCGCRDAKISGFWNYHVFNFGAELIVFFIRSETVIDEHLKELRFGLDILDYVFKSNKL